MTPYDNNVWKLERQHIQKQSTYRKCAELAVSELELQTVFNVFNGYEACLTVLTSLPTPALTHGKLYHIWKYVVLFSLALQPTMGSSYHEVS
jgi:hypothetical protein